MVFACAGCGAVLTARVSRVDFPDHADQRHGYGLLPALLEPGTYTIRDEPEGPPWLSWAEIGADAAAARGVYVQVRSLSYGPRGTVGIAPGDLRGTVHILEACGGACCGLDDGGGPNLACAGCGRPVAARVDDCGRWQVVWLNPRAVRPVSVEGPAHVALAWTDLREEWPATPPVDHPGTWSPRWEAAAAVALAQVLALSGGGRIAVPEGPVAMAFRPTLDKLLSPGPPSRRLTLAGPGLPGGGRDVALVPRHPQTGEVWPCDDAEAVVPLAAGVWLHMAFHDERRLVPAAAGMPAGVRRDDPPPLSPWCAFRPDPDVFLDALARLPAVREPWLRAIHDRVSERPYSSL
ncbi:hypothetical protein [Nonomuraea sp. WAC 01424]|uniref:hypothetical protein n=1 Tax=Nonomuraea sp. WAC 01424 TaxID=2203200 RepID=UPI0021AD5099|nr:hypothetical protein [Nonomuraea sp. WAC 01424]